MFPSTPQLGNASLVVVDSVHFVIKHQHNRIAFSFRKCFHLEKSILIISTLHLFQNRLLSLHQVSLYKKTSTGSERREQALSADHNRKFG